MHETYETTDGPGAGVTLEIVQFTATPDAEPALLAGRDEMIAAIRAAHPGLLDARLVDLGEGRWMDLVR
jgi:hypothetical protein